MSKHDVSRESRADAERRDGRPPLFPGGSIQAPMVLGRRTVDAGLFIGRTEITWRAPPRG